MLIFTLFWGFGSKFKLLKSCKNVKYVLGYLVGIVPRPLEAILGLLKYPYISISHFLKKCQTGLIGASSFQGLQFLSSDNLSMYLVYAIFIAEVFINTSAILVPLTTYSKDFSKSDDQLNVFNVCNINACTILGPFKTVSKVQRPPCIQCMQWKCFCSLWKVSNSWSTYSVQVLSSGNLSMYSMYASYF